MPTLPPIPLPCRRISGLPPGTGRGPRRRRGAGGHDLGPPRRLATGAEAAAGGAAGPSPERAGPWMPAVARAQGRGWGRGCLPRAGWHKTVSSLLLKTEPYGEFREPPQRLGGIAVQVTCTWEEKPVSILRPLLSVSSARRTNRYASFFPQALSPSANCRGI